MDLNETTFATNGASMIPEFLAPVGEAQLDLHDYALMTYLSDSRFGGGQVSLVGSDNKTAPIDAVIAQQTSGLYTQTYGADAAKRMVSGDFASLYIKPLPAANGCYLGNKYQSWRSCRQQSVAPCLGRWPSARCCH